MTDLLSTIQGIRAARNTSFTAGDVSCLKLAMSVQLGTKWTETTWLSVVIS